MINAFYHLRCHGQVIPETREELLSYFEVFEQELIGKNNITFVHTLVIEILEVEKYPFHVFANIILKAGDDLPLPMRHEFELMLGIPENLHTPELDRESIGATLMYQIMRS